MDIMVKNPTFCELVAGVEQIDMESESREFAIKLRNVETILRECGALVEAHINYFQRTIQQFAECHRQNEELLALIPRTPEIITNYHINLAEANRIWLDINRECDNVLLPIQTVIKLLDEAQIILINNQLVKWKADQLLIGYTSSTKSSNLYEKNPHLEIELNEIQKEFENLFGFVCLTQELLKTIHNCYLQWNYVDVGETNASSAIETIQRKVIRSSFIVESQPQQVIHKNVGFQAIVRLLLPNFITIPEEPCVTASILSVSQVQEQLQEPALLKKEKVSGEISIEKKSGFHLLAPQRLMCDLRQMKLTKIVRSEKEANASVMYEKFAIRFECKLLIKNTPFNIWTMSFPLAVGTHGNQDTRASGTILWDNSFFKINRIPFNVCNEVPWTYMEWALSTEFGFQTNCYLREEHLQYMYKKISGPSPRPDQTISWDQFCVDPLNGSKFTFFTWFYDATKLTRLYLSKHWKHIHGFITKEHAEQLLFGHKTGTFLFRFSDSELGGISIAWVTKNATIEHIQPFTIKEDFEATKRPRSIGDLIRNDKRCIFLYPDIPKDTEFEPYYTKSTRRILKNGYAPKKPPKY